jgi:hypothetical protein
MKIFWYLFTNQFETVLNYLYYPYLFTGSLTYCSEGDCNTYKVLPYYLAVLLTDGLLLTITLRFFLKNNFNKSSFLDSEF